MVTERTIINFLIIGASFILVPFLVSSTLTFDYGPAFCLGGLFAVVVAFFLLKDTLCIWPLLGGSILGSLNFLPLPLQASQIFCILLILYYITGYLIIKHRQMKLGMAKFFWPILIVTLIVLYHNHNLNVRALGGDTEGAKPAILIYLVVLAYFCGINVTSPSVDFLSKVPIYSVILTAVSSLPFLLTTVVPGLAPYLYYITDSVNVTAYVDAQSSTDVAAEGVIGRLAAFGPLGTTLQLCLLCYYPIGTWLRPDRWWVAGLSLGCVVLAIASGYRNVLFGFALVTMVGAWSYYSWRFLFLPLGLFIAGLMLVVASSNDIIHFPENKFPLIAQRTLSFIPGDWDKEALDSAKSSNEFRKGIQDVYIREYLKKSPLIGNGFNINTKEFEALNNELKKGVGADHYIESKTYIEGKMFHTGWLSVYDIVGVIGSAAFIALGLAEIGQSAHFILGPKADRRSSLFPFYVWMLCSTVNAVVTFFTVFGDFKQTFMNLCIYAIVLSQLADLENTTEVPIAIPDSKRRVAFSGLKSPSHGYPSRP